MLARGLAFCQIVLDAICIDGNFNYRSAAANCCSEARKPWTAQPRQIGTVNDGFTIPVEKDSLFAMQHGWMRQVLRGCRRCTRMQCVGACKSPGTGEQRTSETMLCMTRCGCMRRYRARLTAFITTWIPICFVQTKAIHHHGMDKGCRHKSAAAPSLWIRAASLLLSDAYQNNSLGTFYRRGSITSAGALVRNRKRCETWTAAVTRERGLLSYFSFETNAHQNISLSHKHDHDKL